MSSSAPTTTVSPTPGPIYYGGSTRNFVLPAGATTTTTVAPTPGPIYYGGATRNFVLPAGATTTTTTSTATGTTTVAPTPGPIYYGGATRSFVYPGATPIVAAPAPVVAATSSKPVEVTSSSSAPATTTVAASTIVSPTPGPIYYGGATRSYVLPAGATTTATTSTAVGTTTVAPTPGPIYYGGATRNFVLPAGTTTTTTTTTSTAVGTTTVAPTPGPIYYGGATRSFVLPAAAAPAPVAAATSSTVVATSSTAVPATSTTTVVAPTPGPIYYGGATRSYVLPATGATPAPVDYTYAPVPTTRSFAVAPPQAKREVLFELNLDQYQYEEPEPEPTPAPAPAPAPRPIRAGDQPFIATNTISSFPVAGRHYTITVVSASGLPSKLTDRTDPYVKVTINGKTLATSYKEDAGKNATWNETLSFGLITGNTGVGKVEVFDKDVFTKDDILGSGEFRLTNGEHTVSLKNAKGKDVGSVVVIVAIA